MLRDGGSGGGEGIGRSVRSRLARVWAALRARALYVLGSLLVYEALLHAVPAWTLVRHAEYLERRELSGVTLIALPVFISSSFAKVSLTSYFVHVF